MLCYRLPKLAVPLVALRAFRTRRCRFQLPQRSGHDLAERRVRKKVLVDERRPQIRNCSAWGGRSMAFLPEADPGTDLGTLPNGVHAPLHGGGPGGRRCAKLRARVTDIGARSVPWTRPTLLAPAGRRRPERCFGMRRGRAARRALTAAGSRGASARRGSPT